MVKELLLSALGFLFICLNWIKAPSLWLKGVFFGPDPRVKLHSVWSNIVCTWHNHTTSYWDIQISWSKPWLVVWRWFFQMIISNLAYAKWLKAVKGQQACHKNIGNQTIQRDSDESSVSSLVFLRPKPCAAGGISFAICKSWISSSRRREQH